MRLARIMLVIALAGVPTACGSEGDTDKAADDATSTTATEAAGAALSLVLTDTGIEGPATVTAGLYEVRVTNNTEVPWQLNFARLDPGRTAKDVRDYDAAHTDDDNAGPPPFIKLTGAVSAEPGRSGNLTVVLTEADWVLIAFTEDENAKPLDKELEVTAGDAAAKLPATPAEIDATDFAYTIRGLTAGAHRVTLRNSGAEPHIFVVFGLKPEGRIDDVLAFEGEGDAPGATGFERDLSYLNPGFAAVSELDLPAGKYGLVCFLTSPPDDPNGTPHFSLGMKQEFTVA